MSEETTLCLGEYIQAFFADYLTNQRNLSPNTILSYRDAFKLFLPFAASHHGKRVADLEFGDVGPKTVLAFLEDLEHTRGCSVRTRNARLAALHTFFRYVAEHEPLVLGLCQRVSAIPVKKARPSIPVYLEFDEVVHILDCIDCSTKIDRRDHLLVHILFETGARAQEVADMRTCSFRLSPPHQVRIVGKGRKERVCPIRAGTAILIRNELRARGLTTNDDEPLFVGARGQGLTRFGILRAVQRRVHAASATLPTLADKRVGAHTFRHTAAIHLLRSGNALPVIRSWLGHVSVVTTDQYTRIDLDMKRRALEASEPPSAAKVKTASWKQDPDILAWLEDL